MKNLAIVMLLAASSAFAAEPGWGTLRGRFEVEGPPPAAPELNPGNDQCCVDAKPKSERVLVAPDGGLANVVVYLRSRQAPPIHPDLVAAPSDPLVVTNKSCSFQPHIALLRTGQELRLANDDPTLHNVNAALDGGEAFNVVLPVGGQQTVKLNQPQMLPAPIACNIHKFMQGYLVVRDDPYMAVSNAKGELEIAKLPAGEWEFQLWHETGYLKNVSTTAGASDRRGRIKVTIPTDGEVNLGDVKVPAELLQ
jgi:plastocyanin